MATFVYLEKTDETVTSYREVGKPALYKAGSASGGVSLEYEFMVAEVAT